jgi:hypothetical protein
MSVSAVIQIFSLFPLIFLIEKLFKKTLYMVFLRGRLSVNSIMPCKKRSRSRLTYTQDIWNQTSFSWCPNQCFSVRR